MKFTINAKDLKAIIEKMETVIDKKSTYGLDRIILETKENQLTIHGTNEVHQLTLTLEKEVWNVAEGNLIVIELEDLKPIKRLSGDITFNVKEEGKISVSAGKKTIAINTYEITDLIIVLPSGAKEIGTVNNLWFAETIEKLTTFTSSNEVQKIMQCINFNISSDRVDALDSYRIGMRKLSGDFKRNGNFMLHNIANKTFKKLINSKTAPEELTIKETDTHIFIEGKGFTYAQKKVAGDYFKVDQMLTNEYAFCFNADRKSLLETMKFDKSLMTMDDINKRKPVIFRETDGNLYLDLTTNKYDVSDKLEVEDLHMKQDFLIGMNPIYWIDALSVLDTEKVFVRGSNPKSPVFIEAEDYSMLVLPLNLTTTIPNTESYIAKRREVA